MAINRKNRFDDSLTCARCRKQQTFVTTCCSHSEMPAAYNRFSKAANILLWAFLKEEGGKKPPALCPRCFTGDTNECEFTSTCARCNVKQKLRTVFTDNASEKAKTCCAIDAFSALGWTFAGGKGYCPCCDLEMIHPDDESEHKTTYADLGAGI